MDEDKRVDNNNDDELSQEESKELINQEDQTKEKEDVKDTEEINKKLKRKKVLYLVIGGLVCAILLICFFTSTNNESIVSGVYLYNEKISSEKIDSLESIINSSKVKLSNKSMKINTEDNSYDIKVDELINKYYVKECSDEISEYSINTNKFQVLLNNLTNKDKKFSINLELDENEINNTVENIELENRVESKDAALSINAEEVNFTQEKEGKAINTQKLSEDIITSINNIDDLNKDIEINVEYEVLEPEILKKEIENINTKISSYNTYYGGGNGRGDNIEIAAKKLDNLLLMPGEEFSYENAVGPVTYENGYKNASVIINGEIQDGVGGGVCQVSSTMYNAQLKAGILPTERRNHSKSVDYVRKGLDATLASGLIDYKFENTYDYPIAINTYTANGRVYIEFWSKEGVTNGIEYKPESYISSNVANTYLYGYDKNGDRVYEKHVDTSVYR